MTSTTIDRGCPAPATEASDPWHLCLLHMAVRAVRNWIGPFNQVSALFPRCTLARPEPDRGLTAISDYAQFIAAHPDMPSDHKDRFLGEIVRCCGEMRTAST